MPRRARAAILAAALLSLGSATAAICRDEAGSGPVADRPLPTIFTGVAPVSAAPAAEPPATARPSPRPLVVPELIYSGDWLAGRPLATGGTGWRCLTEALYFEARGEDPRGQFAVAEVILNRVDSARFPNEVCAVIHQGTGRKWQCQFTYTCDGLPETVYDRGSWGRMGVIARLALDGAPRGLTDGALFYHADYVSPSWSRVFFRTASIGAHHFYSPETQLASN